MTFPIQTIPSAVIMQISGVSGLVFRKERVQPIRTRGTLSQYELPKGLYEICQDTQYWYLHVADDGTGKYVTASGAMQEAGLLEQPSDSDES